jgi:hypothetical protein
VPGHGSNCQKKETDFLKTLLTELRDGIQQCLEKGLSLEQSRREIQLPSFKDLQALDLLKYDIEAVYNSLKKK